MTQQASLHVIKVHVKMCILCGHCTVRPAVALLTRQTVATITSASQALDAAPRAGYGLAEGESPRQGERTLLRIIDPLLRRVREVVCEVARRPRHMLALVRGVARAPGIAAAPASARGGRAPAGHAESERPHARCRVTPSRQLGPALLGARVGAHCVAAAAAHCAAAAAARDARAAACRVLEGRGRPQCEAPGAPRRVRPRRSGHYQGL